MVGSKPVGAPAWSESDRHRTAPGWRKAETFHGSGWHACEEGCAAGVRGADRATYYRSGGMHNRTGRPPRQAANPLQGHDGRGPRHAEPRIVGCSFLIQITPQLRILVAIEAIDARKGIDSLAQLCREKLDADPFSGCVFIFRSRRGTSIKILSYDGQGFWLATKRLSKGRFQWWPTGSEAARTLRAHQAQLLLAAGNPEADAPPVWRPVSR